jgi:hypothetical protein
LIDIPARPPANLRDTARHFVMPLEEAIAFLVSEREVAW